MAKVRAALLLIYRSVKCHESVDVQDFLLTDHNKDIKTDEDIQQLEDGSHLWAIPRSGSTRLAPMTVSKYNIAECYKRHQHETVRSHWQQVVTIPVISLPLHSSLAFKSQASSDTCSATLQERVSFQPHPKTLTMAGELEYWAAQVGCSLVANAVHGLQKDPWIASLGYCLKSCTGAGALASTLCSSRAD